MIFDRSLLPRANFEFVVISDTHHMIAPETGRVEFPSRLRQAARAEVGMRLAVALNADFIVHVGDLVQEYPETEAFEQSLDQVQATMQRCEFTAYHVAGNQDIGDKPDPTMPTAPVTLRSLQRFQHRFGCTWKSFDHCGAHFIIINSQILNSDLPEARQQQEWLEGDLARHHGKRTFLFFHLPLYLWNAEEPDLGHYDNIGQPARSWLIDLIRQYKIEMVFTGHVHWRFFDRIGATRYLVTPSTSFTRPGFSHMFTGPAPPEQGRDDADKLGLFLVRVFPDRSDVHYIRTHGLEILPTRIDQGPLRYLLTCTPACLPASPLGISLGGSPAPAAEVPLAWPSVTRQQIRNDFPLLACLELGVPNLRVAASVLQEPLQRQHLAKIRAEGVRLTAWSLWSDRTAPIPADALAEQMDGWECQIPGGLPSDAALRALEHAHKVLGLSVTLTAVMPHEQVAGKQHRRTRTGYLVSELPALIQRLAQVGGHVDRVLCQLDGSDNAWCFFRKQATARELESIGGIDFLIQSHSLDDRAIELVAVEMLFAAALCPSVRVFFDPLIDMDRTMDVSHGLLDTHCDPRPAFHSLRCLNSILFNGSASSPRYEVLPGIASGVRLIQQQQRAFYLCRSRETLVQEFPQVKDHLATYFTDQKHARLYQLAAGTVQEVPSLSALERIYDDGIALLEVGQQRPRDIQQI